MKRVWACSKGSGVSMALAPLCKGLEAALELGVPLVISHWVDGRYGKGWQGFLGGGWLLFVFCFLGFGLSVLGQYFAARAAVDFGQRLRQAVFSKVQSLSFGQLEQSAPSRWITAMAQDTANVQSGLNLSLRLLTRSPLVVFGAGAMAIYIHPAMAPVFVWAICLLGLTVGALMYLGIRFQSRVQSGLDVLLRMAREHMEGLRVLRAFAVEEDWQRREGEQVWKIYGLQRRGAWISSLLNPISLTIVYGASLIILQWAGSAVDRAWLARGEAVALLSYMSQIFAELVKLAYLVLLLSKSLAGASRLEDILAIEEGDGERRAVENGQKAEPALGREKALIRENPIELEQALGIEKAMGRENALGLENALESEQAPDRENTLEQKQAPTQEQAPIQKQDPALELRHVDFAYPGRSRPVLRDIHFSLGRGESLGILGATGSGKTTLAHICMGLLKPGAGQVIRGRGVELALASQHSQLFAGTLAYNLGFGREDASREVLLEALSLAQCGDILEKSPLGLEQPVEPGGRNFSGGQRQRIHLARALAMDPDVLIMDDVASALDSLTESRLRSALAAKEGMARVVISQRVRSLRELDAILVLEEGAAVGYGNHAHLLAHCALYREICLSQGIEVGNV